MARDTFDWGDLLLYLRRGKVVPVIGRELSLVATDAGSVPVDEHVAGSLAAELDVPLEGLARPTVRAVAARYLATRRNPNRIYAKLMTVLEREPLEPAGPLRQLAAIDDFQLFVSTAWDGLLEAALQQVRGGASAVRSYAYSPFAALQDLEAAPRQGDPAVVYHLLGRASPFPDYAVHDEDTLEFLHALQSDGKRPVRLLDHLRERHLLFIGCGFPDWLTRFFIRTLNGQRFLAPRDASGVVADDRVRGEPELVDFLRQFETSVFVEASPPDFVAELHRRWTTAAPARATSPALATGPGRVMPDGAVFISYARENQEAARLLQRALEAGGVDAWFDDRDLGPGHWETQIDESIRRCALFLPLLSQVTRSAQQGYFFREWRSAIDRSRSIAPTVPFLIPISVDGTGPSAANVPREFQEVQWAEFAEGRPTPRLVDFVRTAIRRVRASHYG